MTETQQKALSEQLIKSTLIEKEENEEAVETDIMPSFWLTLKSWKLWSLLTYGVTLAVLSNMAGLVMPVIAANFFKNHSNNKDVDGSSAYSFYNGISTSIGGLLGFFFEGYIGRLSDAFGRKKIMICMWTLYVLPNLLLLISNFNMWIYLIFHPLSYLSGTFGGMPTVLQAAMSDVCKHPNHITIAFAVGFGVAGLFLIIGAILCNIIVTKYGINTLYYIFLFGMIFDLLWLIFIIKETLPNHLRKPMNDELEGVTHYNVQSNNPFKVFKRLKNNKILFWICMLALFTSFPENGITDFLSSYIDDILNLINNDNNNDNNDKATFVNSIDAICMALTLLISQLIITPLLFKFFNSDILLFFIGILAECLMMTAGILLYFWREIYGAFIIWIMFGLTFILIPITNGSLSSRMNEREQGVSIGVLHAVKGLTAALAPFMFGSLYDLYNWTHHKYEYLKLLPWIIGLLLTIIAFIILYGPLKTVLNQFDTRKRQSIDNIVIN